MLTVTSLLRPISAYLSIAGVEFGVFLVPSLETKQMLSTSSRFAIAFAFSTVLLANRSVLAQQTDPVEKAMSTSSGFAMHSTPPQGLEGVYAFYQETFGFVPHLAQIMAESPALLHSYLDTQSHLKKESQLSQAEINIVQMAISVENKCKYCTAGHTMAGQAFFKTPMQQMISVRKREDLSDPKLRELRNFAIRVYMGKGQVSPEHTQRFFDAGYTKGQALDVVACIAAKVMSNYTNALANTPIDAPFKPLAEGLSFDQ